MIDVDEMRNVLKQCDIYVKENDKNFIFKGINSLYRQTRPIVSTRRGFRPR